MQEKIDKPKFRLKPNLENYEETCKKFQWSDVHGELEWFDGRLNIAHEAIDRHANSWRKNKVALYLERENETSEKYTFLEMKHLSNKFANVLKTFGIEKGDRIFIFLPRTPELYISYIGILKTGAIAATLFSAFGPEALRDRLQDSGARAVITNSELKARLYEVKGELPELEYVILTDEKNPKEGEVSYTEEMKKVSRNFAIEKMAPEDSSFMLYTSGTTGKPKGVVHAHAAIVQQHITAKWVLDIHEEDIFWCTADPGWVTGIAYGIMGSWSNGASSLVYEGRFDAARWYSLIEKYSVSAWYTAPTAVRMLMKAGEELPKKYDLSSLRYVCSVGEPLNPEAIRWGLKVFGLPIHDNWWQTETGGILISNYPSMPIKLGSMGKPFPGITAAIVDADGNELPCGSEGELTIIPGWPAMMKSIWRNEEKYKSYFKGRWFLTGDRAYVDKDGYFWFVGRGDDVIKTSGHRIGPFEVESTLIEHPAVAEAGVIGKPDPVRGEIIKAFVTLYKGYTPSEELKEDIKNFVKKRLAAHAAPREIEIVNTLPKTRSGKIMRRVLKAKELGLPIGDISTLEEY